MSELNNAYIALVDDDTQLRTLLQRFLEKNGSIVQCAHNSDQLELLLKQADFSLIVLDYMLPGENGLQIAERLRKQGNTTPILMLTAKGGDAEAAGYNAGVTDFMAKPFNPNDLLTRIKSVLQSRTMQSIPIVSQSMLETVQVGAWQFDVAKKTLSTSEQHITLAADEHAILKLLVQNAGSIVNENKLCQVLGKTKADMNDVLVIIDKLRRLIEPNASQSKILTLVRGAGYKLVLEQ